jgi:DNA polymerase
MNAPRTPPTPCLTAPALRWAQALGLGPLYVRRSVLQQPVSGCAASVTPPPDAATRTAAQAPSSPPTPARSRPPLQPASGDSRASAIAQMDWDALRAAALACRACKLGGLRHQAVFGTGSTQARWMIVGEAPGAEEDRQGEPFVGAAGQLLDAMLHAIGLDRRSNDPQHAVYIANVLKCRPPGNRNPEPDEIAQCAPLLQRQIALLQPRIILALGRFAAQSLLGSDAPIGKLRGQVHHHAGIAVVVSYHPAYLLRNPVDKARAWRDLCLARDTLRATTPG